MKYTKKLHEELRMGATILSSDYFGYSGLEWAKVEALLDEIERLQSESAWIPVSEKAPEYDGEYLVIKSKGNEYDFAIEWFDRLYHWQDGMRDFRVTHWRHLPAAPEVTNE